MNNLKNYLITDPKYYSNNTQLFEKTLSDIFKNRKIDIACFRDKESENFEELAKIFIKTCKDFNINKSLINTDYNLAYKLNAFGVHLNSTQFDKIKIAKNLKLYTIISCHTFDDIKNAINSQIDAITYSPIFETPNKGEPKGIKGLEDALDTFKDLKIIALGGIINDTHISLVSQTKAYGFASIRYFI
ncbi:MAG: thiamine phosphate synthase [Aliarcobacter sp.]|nr:thiamine phosphate synthase [Aliarcobacter sp.]